MRFWTNEPPFNCKIGDNNAYPACLCYLRGDQKKPQMGKCSANSTVLCRAKVLLSLSRWHVQKHSDLKGGSGVRATSGISPVPCPSALCRVNPRILTGGSPLPWLLDLQPTFCFLSFFFSFWCPFQAALRCGSDSPVPLCVTPLRPITLTWVQVALRRFFKLAVLNPTWQEADGLWVHGVTQVP